MSEKNICGIVMPISSLDGCNENHWADVLQIINEAVDNAGFEANIVSNSDDVTIIHKNIIRNLYENPVVVCDVSGKNPNVMFELGIRLAFDKPTIIIKDDKTSYSFDTSGIEHIEYPRDLRFSKIVLFKEKLAEKIKATHEKSLNDPDYTTFLKHFGEFKVAKLEKKEVSGQEFILEELQNIKSSIRRLEIPSKYERNLAKHRRSYDLDICLSKITEKDAIKALEITRDMPPVKIAKLDEISPSHWHLLADLKDKSIDVVDFEKFLKKQLSHIPRLRISRSEIESSTNIDDIKKVS